MRVHKVLQLILLVGLIGSLCLSGLPIFAHEAEELRPVPVPPPTKANTIPDTDPLANTLNPKSPNYNPDHRYGQEGTRFGPPGERGLAPTEQGEETLLEWETHRCFGTILPITMEMGEDAEEAVEGAWAAHQVFDDIEVDELGDILYAPTLFAPNYCRLESVTHYYLTAGGMHGYWRVWEHVPPAGGGGFIYNMPLDATFFDKYVRNGYYQTAVQKLGGGRWQVQIYNYNRGKWETKETEKGSSDFVEGWCVWEEYDLDNTWPTLPEIRAYDIKVKVDGDWYPADGSYAREITDPIFPFPELFPYYYGWNSQYDDWYVGPSIPDYVLSMGTNGSGSTDPAVGDHVYLEGTEVDILAIPAENWYFLDWTGDVADPYSPSTTVIMDTNQEVIANFTQEPPISNITLHMVCRASNPDITGPGDPDYGSYRAGELLAFYPYIRYGCYEFGDYPINLVSAWTEYTHDWPTNPRTGNSWTRDEVNSLAFGSWLWASAWTPVPYTSSWCTQTYLVVDFVDQSTVTLRPSFVILPAWDPFDKHPDPIYWTDWSLVDEPPPHDGELTYVYGTTSGGPLPQAGSYKAFSAPTDVQTDSASNITSSSVTLNGTCLAYPRNLTTAVYFEYGTSTGYGYRTADQSKGIDEAFSEGLADLESGETYHYRAVITNDFGTFYGADTQFTTL